MMRKEPRDVRTVAIVLATLLVGAATPFLYAQGDGAKARISVRDGVYTEEQAERGKSEYDYNCSSCHIHDLSGDSIKDVPPLAGADFLAVWDGKTVKELLDFMKMNMPADSRGSLAANTYTDIAAYILQANMFPAGKEALGSDIERLGRTVIDKEQK
jgi:S-disulfanyl-L-cysteine oxidoreductase SoxD